MQALSSQVKESQIRVHGTRLHMIKFTGLSHTLEARIANDLKIQSASDVETAAIRIVATLVAIPTLILNKFRSDSACDLTGALRFQMRSRIFFAISNR